MNLEMIHNTEGRGGARGAPKSYTVHTRSKLLFILYNIANIESS